MSDQPLPCAGDGAELAVQPLDPVLLAEVLEALALRLESLEGLVAAVTDQLVEAPAGGPWSWRQLGPSQTRALFTELRDWVDWLIARYELRGEAETIPPCWFLHPVAVEELTALMVDWRAGYSQKGTAPSDALAGRHDRWLWPTLHRLEAGSCRVRADPGGGHDPLRGRGDGLSTRIPGEVRTGADHRRGRERAREDRRTRPAMARQHGPAQAGQIRSPGGQVTLDRRRAFTNDRLT